MMVVLTQDLQEFKVEGAMLPAEFGLTANMVNVTLKSGTNQFRPP